MVPAVPYLVICSLAALDGPGSVTEPAPASIGGISQFSGFFSHTVSVLHGAVFAWISEVLLPACSTGKASRCYCYCSQCARPCCWA